MKHFNPRVGRGFTLIELIFCMVCLLTVVAGIVGVYQMTNSTPGAELTNHRVLRQQGYKNINLGGYPVFKCGNGDNMFMSNTFTAIAPNGDTVSGAVCAAVFKDRTIRLD